ncbi:MAG: sugar ABC transporter permease [Fibrobacteria bacterium]
MHLIEETDSSVAGPGPAAPPAVQRRSRFQRMVRSVRRNKVPYIFLLPTVIGMLLLQAAPILQGLYLGFLRSRKDRLLDYLSAPWAGFENYAQILFNPDSPIRSGLWDAVRNTALYTVAVTIGTLAVGTAAALMVNREFRFRAAARTLMLFPWIVPTYVVGLLWGFLWQREAGLVNIVLVDWLHLFAEKPTWLIGPNTLWAIIIPTIWRQWPFSMLMLLAGLQGISKDVYEAAEIDGANAWQAFRRITWPLLKPVWAILILHGLIFNVYSFNIVIMMFGNGAGFPGKHGDLLMTALFRNSFQMWDFGTGAAMSSLLMLAMMTLVFIWYRIFRDQLTGK